MEPSEYRLLELAPDVWPELKMSPPTSLPTFIKVPIPEVRARRDADRIFVSVIFPDGSSTAHILRLEDLVEGLHDQNHLDYWIDYVARDTLLQAAHQEFRFVLQKLISTSLRLTLV